MSYECGKFYSQCTATTHRACDDAVLNTSMLACMSRLASSGIRGLGNCLHDT